MRILVILCTDTMDISQKGNIAVLDFFMKQTYPNDTVEYCGISSSDDFKHYEHIVTFRYKFIHTKRQFRKVCDFLTEHKDTLDYDWYIKIRPDIRLIEPIRIDGLSESSINARAREYKGPRVIKYGMSTGGEGGWRHRKDYSYDSYEHDIVLDDQIYIFHHTVILNGGFESNSNDDPKGMEEWFHTNHWKSRNIPLHVIGLNVLFTKYNAYSGNINM